MTNEKYQEAADICHLVSVIADKLSYRIAPGLRHQRFDPRTIERLALGSEFDEHIKSAIEYSMGVADIAVSQAITAIANVRRFAA